MFSLLHFLFIILGSPKCQAIPLTYRDHPHRSIPRPSPPPYHLQQGDLEEVSLYLSQNFPYLSQNEVRKVAFQSQQLSQDENVWNNRFMAQNPVEDDIRQTERFSPDSEWFDYNQMKSNPAAQVHKPSPAQATNQGQNRFSSQNAVGDEVRPNDNFSPDSEWFDYNNFETPSNQQARKSSLSSSQILAFSPDSNWSEDSLYLSQNEGRKVAFQSQGKRVETPFEATSTLKPILSSTVVNTMGVPEPSIIQAYYDDSLEWMNVLDEAITFSDKVESSTKAPPILTQPPPLAPCSTPNTTPCGPNSLCHPTLQGPVCSCKPGYFMTGSSSACHDVDECLLTPGICGAGKKCTNTAGSYSCSCKDGYQLEGGTEACRDVNECLEEDDPCGAGATCVNTEGSYACLCGAGFVLNRETEECEDVDECSAQDDVCGENTVCSNTEGSFSCLCKAGYAKRAGTCEDVDECLSIGMCGANSLCFNTEGSYKCECEEGFAKDDLTNTCVDTNECLEEYNNPCGDGADCVNTVGSYACLCGTGFVLNRETEECEDVDECSAQDDVCGENTVCSNTEGSFSCLCKAGYASTRSGTCEDVDECLTSPGMCGANSVCANTEGSYNCLCEEGFSKDDLTNTCEDTDECLNDAGDICEDNLKCVNTVGSYSCQCRQGYEADPALGCGDVDECSFLPPVCGDLAVCTNNEGSFACACGEGFKGDPPAVPCYPEAADCDGEVDCTTTSPQVRTRCKKDEDCLSDSSCKAGQCRCRAGYTEEGLLCVDKDECELHPGICRDNSVCRNQEGGYTCGCKEGFARYPPSYVCSPENRCKQECGDKAECREDEDWEYRCICEEGYVELLGGGCVRE
eukprot:GFUD01042859.1.p1 GENE.GFUD01042859.1~~GFUD01042859.1.p1  ORF type:complete len:854 (+),score=221.56 GFUD01042859.1:54-2615(+)